METKQSVLRLPICCRECEIDEDLKRLVPDMKDAGPTAAALLIECRANGAEGLKVGHRVPWPSCWCCTWHPLCMLSHVNLPHAYVAHSEHPNSTHFLHLPQARIHEVNSALIDSGLPFGAHSDQLKDLETYPFRKDDAESKVFWDVRKGLIPIVGGGREAGECLAKSLPAPVHQRSD